MSDAPVLLILGILFLLGLGADLLGRHTPVPRVTLLIICGLAVGPAGFDLLPPELIRDWFPPLTILALSLIGFLLGHKLSLDELRAHGRVVLGITIGETTGALLLVALTLLLLGVHPVVALLLAGVATATAPAATFDIVSESGIRGAFPDTLLAVVALDDAWALFLFSVMLSVAATLNGDSSISASLVSGLLEIGGSLLLGAGLGIPMAYLTGRVRPGEPTLAEAIGFVLLCGGIATWMDLSPILSAMVMGGVVASLASHHDRPFHAIEGIEWPFLILFFILAGASAHPQALLTVGAITIAYITARCIGSYAGARAGARWAGADPATRKWMGLCLFPQAGVALGMALIASQRFPEFEAYLLPVVLASTIIYELVSPMVTRKALQLAQPA
ncbi:MAG: cation:proton antiporter [Xanthomonadales bacterium]|jgi:Kef-type K+ transport system membrane component KefB|nr:cation:proton antiporter [Xanthomonadales bacterium]MDH3923053.1 cation:proton antiporter [Xanthomonadales bacterium]MDH4001055.1 cation:proton antiporter [Xanthomonadales bacterium]